MVKKLTREDHLIEIQSLISNNQYHKALSELKKVVEEYPDDYKLRINYGNIHHFLGNITEAKNEYEKSLELSKSKEALNNLAVIHIEKRDYENAIKLCNDAIGIDASYADAYYNISLCFELLDDYTESLNNLNKCLDIDGNHFKAMILKYKVAQNTCDWPVISELEKILNDNIEMGLEHPFMNVSRYDDERINYRNARSWQKNNQSNIVSNDISLSKTKNEKIKIGFMCGEFRNHPTFFLIKNLFKHINRKLFNIYVFSYAHENYCREYIEKDVDNFIDINDQSNDLTETKVKSFNLDILIDLSVLIPHNKMSIIKRKLAKSTVSYLGFPGTSCAENYDYIIADRIVIPETEREFYSEKIIYLPNFYQVNDGEIKARQFDNNNFKLKHQLPLNKIILSCFNQSFKIEKSLFECWINILKKHKSTVIWLLKENQIMQNNITKFASNLGIEIDRIIFADRLPRDMHLQRLCLSDIALDTLTYNGHTTTTDAIQCGIPIVGFSGNHFASRVSHSLLKSINLNELVAFNLEEYSKKIQNLIEDDVYREQISKKLRSHEFMSDFYNLEKFTRDFEKALISIMN